MTPQAPWTKNCMAKAPMPSIRAVVEKAQIAVTGNASSAAAITVRRRPKRWLSVPKTSPPNMAPIL